MWVQSLGQEDPWRRAWQSNPVFLSGESHGQRSLVGYSPWGCKELDTQLKQLSMHASPFWVSIPGTASHRQSP